MTQRRHYEPRAFAQGVMDHFCAHPRCALWGKPGVGKSVMTMHYLDILHNVVGESRPTLILAPLRVARDVWSNECEKWDSLSSLSVSTIVGTPTERNAAMRKDVPIYVTNYENISWLIENLGTWPYGTVVADECVRLKSFRTRQGGERAKALGKVAHKHVERFIELTGTPSPNGLADLWGQAWYLDKGERLGKTYTAFQERWFRPIKMGNFTKWQAMPHAQQEIQELLGDICMSLDPKDWFDLKAPIVNVIEVELPPSARKVYKELEKDFFTQIGSHEIDAFSAASKSSKLLQVCSGSLYTDPNDKSYVVVHDEKIEALRELAEGTGEDPLLVVYQFKSDLCRLRLAFPDHLDLSVDHDLRKAKVGRGKIWLAQPASVGEGIDGLQEHCNTIVFFAQDWNLGLHDQILERVGPMRQYQSGKDRPVFVHYIVARNSIDEVVMERRSSKRDVQELLLEYVKRKK